MTRYLFLLIFLTLSSPALAWLHKPEVGLGFTNNANYEATDRDSDFYLWLRNFSAVSSGRRDFSLWASYKDYFKESQNDAFTWRAGMSHSSALVFLPGWEGDIGIGGQHFVKSSPGTTEENFSNLFFDASLMQTYPFTPDFDLSFEFGYEAKNYTDISGRTDHRLYLLSSGLIDLPDQHKLVPSAEIGFVASSDSVYSRNYLSLAGEWTWQTSPTLQVGADFYHRATSYPSRRVSVATLIARKRNSFRATSQDETESHGFTQLQGTVVKSFGRYSGKGVLYIANQNSKSGFEDYSETGAKASLIFSF